MLRLQLFETRQQWLSGYDEMAGWLERTAQNVLQLEHSREGVVWSLSAGVDKNSFVECSALLQQRQYMVSALDAAKEQVRPAYSLTAVPPSPPFAFPPVCQDFCCLTVAGCNAAGMSVTDVHPHHLRWTCSDNQT